MNNKEIELVNDLWQLWEDIHMAGQLVTNKDFNPKYMELKMQVKNLNLHPVIVPVCKHYEKLNDWCNKYRMQNPHCGHCKLQTEL